MEAYLIEMKYDRESLMKLKCHVVPQYKGVRVKIIRDDILDPVLLTCSFCSFLPDIHAHGMMPLCNWGEYGQRRYAMVRKPRYKLPCVNDQHELPTSSSDDDDDENNDNLEEVD